VALAKAVLAVYHSDAAARAAMGTSGRRYFEQHFERTMLLGRLDEWMKELRPCAS
jgi:hypothetical protein